jgi:transcriptional regulator with PAS, ATPase and Fis domain
VADWRVAQQIRSYSPHTPTVVLFEPESPLGLQSFATLPRCEKIPRPARPALISHGLQLAADKYLVTQSDDSAWPKTRNGTLETIVGKSEKMLDVFSLVAKVAASNVNVCIIGESGTGKELIARAIHYTSARRDRPLITLDCTAVPEGLMESHLFGHVKGAYTGAAESRDGVFSLAHTGTLFIDELGELSPHLQAKLLRVIQTREFGSVGGTKPIRTNIRLITATNKDLAREVDRGAFRKDLYYRIAVVMIRIPPLRERRDDIPLLVDYFIRKFSRAYSKPILGIEPAAMSRLKAFAWPGNVRQLEHLIEQAVVLSGGDMLTEAVLFAGDYQPAAGLSPSSPLEPGLPLREVERHYILGTLQKVHGNRTQAARLLGISLRGLQYKLKVYHQDSQSVSTQLPPRIQAMTT